jgi:hypothetical protein
MPGSLPSFTQIQSRMTLFKRSWNRRAHSTGASYMMHMDEHKDRMGTNVYHSLE